jgi:hypothetical protein
MVTLAESHGWACLVTYAKGRFPHGTTGAPGAVKESLAVRMARGSERAVAVYVGGAGTWSWGTLVRFSPEAFTRYPLVGAFLADLA